mgnify:CR=1 FL=1
MKQSELREIVKQTILENQQSSTKLGKNLSEGDILSANGKKIISIERNKPLQGKLTVKVEGSNKPLIFDEQSEYGITISLKVITLLSQYSNFDTQRLENNILKIKANEKNIGKIEEELLLEIVKSDLNKNKHFQQNN